MQQCVFDRNGELLGFADTEEEAEMVVQATRDNEGMYYWACPDPSWEEVNQHG